MKKAENQDTNTAQKKEVMNRGQIINLISIIFTNDGHHSTPKPLGRVERRKKSLTIRKKNVFPDWGAPPSSHVVEEKWFLSWTVAIWNLHAFCSHTDRTLLPSGKMWKKEHFPHTTTEKKNESTPATTTTTVEKQKNKHSNQTPASSVTILLMGHFHQYLVIRLSVLAQPFSWEELFPKWDFWWYVRCQRKKK